MSNKLQYCKRILNTYSLLVDFEGELDRENVPAPLDQNETFHKWKTRVLGNDVSEVIVYQATVPRGNTTISALQRTSHTKHIEQVLRSVAKEKKEKIKAIVEQTKEETANIYKSFSIETLKDLIDETEYQLEPSVKEFFDRYFQDTQTEIDAVELIRNLLFAYNSAVKAARNMNTHEM